MLFGRLLEKDIGPSIDEEADIRSIGDLPSAADAIGLIDGVAEFSIRRKAILQVAAYSPGVDRQSDGLAHEFLRVAIAAFQIDRHGKLCRVDNPAQIGDCQGERDAFAIGKTIRLGDRPTARRNRPGTASGDGLGAASIPDVEED
jgi:hypothetical protein